MYTTNNASTEFELGTGSETASIIPSSMASGAWIIIHECEPLTNGTIMELGLS